MTASGTCLEADVLRSVQSLLHHRGPDAWGAVYGLPNGEIVRRFGGEGDLPSPFIWFMLHTRLSVLDLTADANQPMSASQGRYWINYNGEIYNYRELRRDLERLGFTFRTRGDTEVLLAAFVQWGVETFDRLVGMFACAIYDAREARLILARDHLGIKPLYYTQADTGLYYSSEIKALLKLGGVQARANPSRLYAYLAFGASDDGRESMFSSVLQIPPGHYMEYNLASGTCGQAIRFSSLEEQEECSLSFLDMAELLKDTFLESVSQHLRSDVEIGVTLSGGIDSASIALAAQNLMTDRSIHSFSYISDDARFSEEAWIDCMVRERRFVPHAIRVSPEEFRSDVFGLVRMQEQPFYGTSLYAQYRVYESVRENGLKVVLDGQGADELFSGYKHFLSNRIVSLVQSADWDGLISVLEGLFRHDRSDLVHVVLRSVISLLPPALRRELSFRFYKSSHRGWINLGWFQDHGVQEVRDSSPPWPESNTLKAALKNEILHTSLPRLLRYQDRNSMCHSVETRVPFLHQKLVKMAFSIPERYLVGSDGSTKYIWRHAMRSIVPERVLKRRDKIAFETPEARWIQELLKLLGNDVKQGVNLELPILHNSAIRQWIMNPARSAPSGRIMWRLLNVLIWSRVFEVSYD